MQNTISLKENRDFLRLYRRGKSFPSDCLVVYVMKNRLGVNRLGITCSKKVGNAVIRNRTRRKIKECYRELEKDIKCSYDIVIVARVKAGVSDYKKIMSGFRYVLKKSQLFSD